VFERRQQKRPESRKTWQVTESAQPSAAGDGAPVRNRLVIAGELLGERDDLTAWQRRLPPVGPSTAVHFRLTESATRFRFL
jgi:hypothetical protein